MVACIPAFNLLLISSWISCGFVIVIPNYELHYIFKVFISCPYVILTTLVTRYEDKLSVT